MRRSNSHIAFVVFSILLPITNVSSKPTPVEASLRRNRYPQLEDGQDPCSVDPYESPELTYQSFPPFDEAQAEVYRYRQQSSVNLGSWFVHEAWMTPSVFRCAAGIGEVDIANGWNSTSSARSVLERHWDTFITESDFAYLASIGINTVRLPIGYWSLGPDFLADTPFAEVAEVYQGSYPRIIRTINWASKYGIGVLVDLHGAVGSQNGQQHSGVSDHSVNLFNNEVNIEKTINVLTFLARRLSPVTNVVGVQILNEPAQDPGLPDFYSRAIAEMRAIDTKLPLYIHDAFNISQFMQFIFQRNDFIVEDHHSYFVFSDAEKVEPASSHTNDVKNGIAQMLADASAAGRGNLVVDEYSCALTNVSLSSEQDQEEARRDFCLTQMEVYSKNTAGWSFWSYNKESCDDDPGWCFRSAVGRSLPSNFYSYNHGSWLDPDKKLTSTIENVVAPLMAEYFVRFFKAKAGSSKHDSDAVKPTSKSHLSSTSRHISREDAGNGDASHSQGYNDGYTTAKYFASMNWSKLGFVDQYISDRIAKSGPGTIQSVEEYRAGFKEGLQQGENDVMAGNS